MALKRKSVPIVEKMRPVALSLRDLEHIESLVPPERHGWSRTVTTAGDYEVDSVSDLENCPDATLASFVLRTWGGLRVEVYGNRAIVSCTGGEAEDIKAVDQIATFLRTRRRKVVGILFDTPASRWEMLTFLLAGAVGGYLIAVAAPGDEVSLPYQLTTAAYLGLLFVVHVVVTMRLPFRHPIILRESENDWWNRNGSKLSFVIGTALTMTAIGLTIYFNSR